MGVLGIRESDGMVCFNGTSIVDLYKKFGINPVRHFYVQGNCGCLTTVLAMEQSGKPKLTFLAIRKSHTWNKFDRIQEILNLKKDDILQLTMGWDQTQPENHQPPKCYLWSLASKAYLQVIGKEHALP